MKNFILCIFILVDALACIGQMPVVDMNKSGMYQEVIELNYENAYTHTLKWIGKTYNSAKTVIESQITNEYIKVNALMPETNGVPAIRYSLEFEFKPYKCRITFTVGALQVQSYPEFYYTGYFKNDGTLREINANKKQRVDGKIAVLVNNYYNYIIIEPSNDW